MIIIEIGNNYIITSTRVLLFLVHCPNYFNSMLFFLVIQDRSIIYWGLFSLLRLNNNRSISGVIGKNDLKFDLTSTPIVIHACNS